MVRALGVDPVGTAGDGRGYLLVDVALPWPRAVSAMAGLAPVLAAADVTGLRVQATVPAPGAAHRVVAHRHREEHPGWFAGYERVEVEVAPGDVVEAAVALAANNPGGTPTAALDVLVCAHGARDVCCGSGGTALALALLADDLPGVRVARTSHTGGHRFAPTAFVLPTGTAWAHADIDLLRRVLARAGPLDDLLARYRGSTGIGLAPAQAAERATFAAVGWSWLDRRRRATVGGDGAVVVEADGGDDGHRAWRVEVAPGKAAPVPDCGQPLSPTTKTERQWLVTGVEEVPPPNGGHASGAPRGDGVRP